jgi:hypothetical protein
MEVDALTPTAEELIDEIAGAFQEHNQVPPDSFTLSDFMALTSARSETTAYRYLERLIDQGKICKVRIGKVNYYYKR